MRTLRAEAMKAKVAAVDKCKDCAKTFQAMREVRDFDVQRHKLVVDNHKGDRIMDDIEAAEFVRTHFVRQFSDEKRSPVSAHESLPHPLDDPIKLGEIDSAIRKLRNGRAVGVDNLSAELLKYGSLISRRIIADVINKAIANG